MRRIKGEIKIGVKRGIQESQVLEKEGMQEWQMDSIDINALVLLLKVQI